LWLARTHALALPSGGRAQGQAHILGAPTQTPYGLQATRPQRSLGAAPAARPRAAPPAGARSCPGSPPAAPRRTRRAPGCPPGSAARPGRRPGCGRADRGTRLTRARAPAARSPCAGCAARADAARWVSRAPGGQASALTCSLCPQRSPPRAATQALSQRLAGARARPHGGALPRSSAACAVQAEVASVGVRSRVSETSDLRPHERPRYGYKCLQSPREQPWLSIQP